MLEPSDGTDLRTCANCGERLDERWYPTTARKVEDGFRLFAFCDAACRHHFLNDD
jgi:hypothetical protein